MEYFDALDKYGNKKGYVIERGIMPEDNETYLGIVSIIVINKDNKILTTKRHPNKPAGALWEVTGGGILAGEEPIDSARRELEEETGIIVSTDQFQLIEKTTADYFFCYTYLVVLDYNPKVVLQKTETIDYKWLSYNDFFEFTKSNSFVSYIGDRVRRILPTIKEKTFI